MDHTDCTSSFRTTDEGHVPHDRCHLLRARGRECKPRSLARSDRYFSALNNGCNYTPRLQAPPIGPFLHSRQTNQTTVGQTPQPLQEQTSLSGTNSQRKGSHHTTSHEAQTSGSCPRGEGVRVNSVSDQANASMRLCDSAFLM
jgi:hypothetical protein